MAAVSGTRSVCALIWTKAPRGSIISRTLAATTSRSIQWKDAANVATRNVPRSSGRSSARADPAGVGDAEILRPHRGFSQHGRIGIQSDHLGEQVRQQQGDDAWPAADIEQSTTAVELERRRYCRGEARRIRQAATRVVRRAALAERRVPLPAARHSPLALAEADVAPVRLRGQLEPEVRHLDLVEPRLVVEQVLPGAVVREGHTHVLSISGEVEHDIEALLRAVGGESPAVIDHHLALGVDPETIAIEPRLPLLPRRRVDVARAQARELRAQVDEPRIDRAQAAADLVVGQLPPQRSGADAAPGVAIVFGQPVVLSGLLARR